MLFNLSTKNKYEKFGNLVLGVLDNFKCTTSFCFSNFVSNKKFLLLSYPPLQFVSRRIDFAFFSRPTPLMKVV